MADTMRDRIDASRHSARMALDGYANRPGNAGEDEIDLYDLIVDLLHLADEYPELGGEEAARLALDHYRAERDALATDPDADPAAVLP